MMTPRSEFDVVVHNNNVVAIVDLDRGAMSVTNDIERVVSWLQRQGILRAQRLLYRDSMKHWDEVLYSSTGFRGFKLLREGDLLSVLPVGVR